MTTVQDFIDALPASVSGDGPDGDAMRTALVQGPVWFVPESTSIVGGVLQFDPVDADLGGVVQSVAYGSEGGIFVYDPLDETTEQDLLFCLVLIGGKRFKRTFDPKGADGNDGAAGADGTDPGILLTFDTSVADSNPAAGKIRANNAGLASATKLFVSKTNRLGNSIETFLLTLADSTNTIKGVLTLTGYDGGSPAALTQAVFNVTAVEDATGYVKVTVQDHDGAAAFSAAALSFQFVRAGDKGDAGAAGSNGSNGSDGADGTDPGVLLTWDEDNSDSDPGSGKIRADDDDLSIAATLFVSKENRGGDDISAFLAMLDNADNTVKGQLVLTVPGGNSQAIFNVTGITDASGYVKVAVAAHSGASGFTAGAISFQFSRAGDAGSDGADGAPGADGADASTALVGGFQVNLNGSNQTGATAAAINIINFSHEEFDTDGWFDTSTHKFTPQSAGYYFISIAGGTTAGTGGDSCQVAIYKNGSSIIGGSYSATGGITRSSCSALVYCNGSTDYIEGRCYVPTGVTTILGSVAVTTMSGFRAGT